MSDKTLKDLKYEAHIAVLNTKVESLIEKQKELTQRVRANEKVVAAIGLLGSIALAALSGNDPGIGCCLSISNASAGAAKYPAPIKASAIDPNRPIAATTFSFARTR